jgi:hypothetical protein
MTWLRGRVRLVCPRPPAAVRPRAARTATPDPLHPLDDLLTVQPVPAQFVTAALATLDITGGCKTCSPGTRRCCCPACERSRNLPTVHGRAGASGRG